VLQSAGLREAVWDEHEQIAKAIGAGKADAAEKLMRGHGVNAGENLQRHMNDALA
jgi:DNA-binding GntR family transcriptional regulator